MIDDNYPTLAFKITTAITQHKLTKNWSWSIEWNVAGPDEVHIYKSDWFLTRRQATEHMLFNFMQTLKKMSKDLYT